MPRSANALVYFAKGARVESKMQQSSYRTGRRALPLRTMPAASPAAPSAISCSILAATCAASPPPSGSSNRCALPAKSLPLSQTSRCPSPYSVPPSSGLIKALKIKLTPSTTAAVERKFASSESRALVFCGMVSGCLLAKPSVLSAPTATIPAAMLACSSVCCACAVPPISSTPAIRSSTPC